MRCPSPLGRVVSIFVCCAIVTPTVTAQDNPTALRAGVAKVDITNLDAGPVNDPLYAKALVLTQGETTVAIVTVDAVAIAEIGSIPNSYLANVRQQLAEQQVLDPAHLIVNASHCHGRVCADVEQRTVQAVKLAAARQTPVRIGCGRAKEDRVSENRRMKLKSGRTVDARHAYSLPPDDAIAEIGPIDPDVGLLKIETLDGRPVAAIYNFACHPIQNIPTGANSADMIGFASEVVEQGLGNGAMALFLQGCGGDINPVRYKDVTQPRDAQPLGQQLGLTVLKGLRQIPCESSAPLKLVSQQLALPRGDNAERIAQLETELLQLVQALQPTSLNLKTFTQLSLQSRLADPYPSSYAQHYLLEKQVGRDHLERFDAENRKLAETYRQNILVMEEMTRLKTNLALLKKHQARHVAAGSRTLDVEMVGLRLGDFHLVTFPGELTVPIGLSLKARSPQPFTFIAGYTNGYIYYAPTREQLLNPGYAQEDCDTWLAPDWQPIFETAALELLKRL